MRGLVDRRLIVDVNIASPVEQLPMRVVWSGFISFAQNLLERPRQSASRHRSQAHAVPDLQGTTGDPAQAVRLLQYRFEHPRQIAGRAVDDLQHLSGRCVPLQSLVILNSAIVQPLLKRSIDAPEISDDLLRIV